VDQRKRWLNFVSDPEHIVDICIVRLQDVDKH